MSVRTTFLFHCVTWHENPTSPADNTTERSVEKEKKQWQKQCTCFCLHLGTCVSRLSLHWSKPGPSKENTHTPIKPFPYPFLPFFLILSSLFLFGSSLMGCLIESPGHRCQKKKLWENPLPSSKSLIINGQYPHEFPIAFYSGLMMCRT